MITKLSQLKKEFSECKESESVYHKIMDYGKKLPFFDPAWKIDDNLVQGCQSLMYLHTRVEDKKLYFSADSDALISKGLASILIYLYSGESAETILKNPPTFLEEIGIVGSLTPGRANGLAGLYLRMQQEALKVLMSK